MMRRDYIYATNLFVNALLYIQVQYSYSTEFMSPLQRTKSTQSQWHQQKEAKSIVYDVVAKTHEQIYHLLSICMALQPQRIDDQIMSQLHEKHQDRMQMMAKGCVVDCVGLK